MGGNGCLLADTRDLLTNFFNINQRINKYRTTKTDEKTIRLMELLRIGTDHHCFNLLLNSIELNRITNVIYDYVQYLIVIAIKLFETFIGLNNLRLLKM